MESKNKKAPAKLHIRSGDTVKVIAGNAKGETGKIKKDSYPEVIKR